MKALKKDVVKLENQFKLMLMFAFIIFASAFLFNLPNQILLGIKTIITSPSILLTDYIEIANLGSAFFNSGLLMILFTILVKIIKAEISGPIVAGIFTIGGFAFFGKNLFNVWPIVFGVFLYTKIKKLQFKDYFVVSMFGTALAPIVSQLAFGFNFTQPVGILLGVIAGVVAGFMLIPLASQFTNFHQGYNLYNVGFTSGIIGTLFMSLFRVFGLNNDPQNILSQGNNQIMAIYFAVLFTVMLIVGFVLNNNTLKGLKVIMGQHKKTAPDYIEKTGFAITLFNMGILGLMSMAYVMLVKGDFNGPVIGALFTVSGFGAFGKHFKNTIFIIIGVYVVTLITTLQAGSTAVLIAALFGTCLAPITSKFGWQYGILAGMIHIMVVLNTASLHGFMNLYNNGFAAGIVAASLLPLLQSFAKAKKSK